MSRPSIATVLIVALAASVCAGAAAGFDGQRAFEHLRKLVLIGPRTSGSAGIGAARAYLKAQLELIGVAGREQAFEAATPVGPIHMVNLTATIPGDRPERLVFGGHYDTKRFSEFEFVGANDAGSSAAFLVELARVLKSRKNPLTMELVWLDGEEAVVEWVGNDHTYGSRHYVERAQRDGSIKSLKAFILVDMIGDRDLAMRREGNSTPWLTDAIWASGRRLGHARVFLDSTTYIEDDHIPFLEAGVPSVDLIDLEYPPWHTSGDTVDKTSAASLQVVGDVLLDALPQIEARLLRPDQR
jgi:Zn-dependent M28 family amino/carboxypeptidase